MVPLRFDIAAPDNDLDEKIDYHVQRALAEEDAMIYAFGERWGPEPDLRPEETHHRGVARHHRGVANRRQVARVGW